jgi:Leucine-rich repeat (LRR) protein
MGKRLSKQIVDDGQVKDESNRKESMSLNEALTTDIMADREEEVIDEKSFFRISRFQLFQDREVRAQDCFCLVLWGSKKLVRRNVGLEGVFLPASAVQIELTVLDLTDNKLTNVDCIASLLNLQNLVLRKNRSFDFSPHLSLRFSRRLSRYHQAAFGFANAQFGKTGCVGQSSGHSSLFG